MNRRTALLTVGGAAVCSLAGCFSRGRSENDAESAAPPLEQIVLWSDLEAGESRRARITVDKDGSQLFETRHEFEGESRFSLVEDWMGDAVPYSITLEMVGTDAATTDGSDAEATYSSSDIRNPGSYDCWRLYGELGPSSVAVGAALGEQDCRFVRRDEQP